MNEKIDANIIPENDLSDTNGAIVPTIDFVMFSEINDLSAKYQITPKRLKDIDRFDFIDLKTENLSAVNVCFI